MTKFEKTIRYIFVGLIIVGILAILQKCNDGGTRDPFRGVENIF